MHRFHTQDARDWLSPKRLTAWLASIGYCGRTDPALLHRHITAAPTDPGITAGPGPGSPWPTRARCRPSTPRSTLSPTDQRSPRPAPRPGGLHQPAPRRKYGRPAARRDRRRPRPIPPQRPRACLAGVAPSTRQSGKVPSSRSAGPWTNNCATPSATSRATPATPTPGPPSSTVVPSTEATTIPTRYGSLPAPGCTYLELLENQHLLRPRPAPSPPSTPHPRSTVMG